MHATPTGNVTVAIGPATGKGFTGQLHERRWRLNVRTKRPPVEVLLRVMASNVSSTTTTLPKLHSTAELEAKASGWFHDRTLQKGAGGLLMVKLPPLACADYRCTRSANTSTESLYELVRVDRLQAIDQNGCCILR